MLPLAAAALGMFAAPMMAEMLGGKPNVSPQILGGLPSAPTFTGQEIGAAVGGEQGFAGTTGMAQSGLGIGSSAYTGPTAQSITDNIDKMNASYKDMAQQYATVGSNINASQNQANTTGFFSHIGNLISGNGWNGTAPDYSAGGGYTPPAYGPPTPSS